jgi:hypothetical protein
MTKIVKIKQLIWRDVEIPEGASGGLWLVAHSVVGTYELHRFDDKVGVYLGMPGGIALTQYIDVLSATDAAQTNFEKKIRSVLI